MIIWIIILLSFTEIAGAAEAEIESYAEAPEISGLSETAEETVIFEEPADEIPDAVSETIPDYTAEPETFLIPEVPAVYEENTEEELPAGENTGSDNVTAETSEAEYIQPDPEADIQEDSEPYVSTDNTINEEPAGVEPDPGPCADGHSYIYGVCENCGDINDGFALVDDVWGWYQDNTLQDSMTGIIYGDIAGYTGYFYISDGIFTYATGITKLADGANNNWYFVYYGVYTKATGIAQRIDRANDNWYYVKKGVYTKSTAVAKLADGSSSELYFVYKGTFYPYTGTFTYNNRIYTIKNGWVSSYTSAATLKSNTISSLIYYRGQGYNLSSSKIKTLLNRLKRIDADDGAAWEYILRYWNYVNRSGFVNTGALPSGLNKDKSLCIVVMGYELYSDGSMQYELLLRLKKAYAAAKKYPNAYILVTGGPTGGNTTEARVMANWLINNGISKKRIILESSSLSTA